ncbi:dopamine receptor type D2 isoform X14 [Nasonia vitripennis]|uniref:Uncharacterized protein n=1 Tax=Nasonia vitripennis TaxID=7425 RepID=A0A7M7QJU4_NASVI|nr:dopamine receptor type D2 isoform X14 [Nasonia vitripennis]
MKRNTTPAPAQIMTRLPRAFTRILCSCCPRRMRRRYQRAFRCKPNLVQQRKRPMR